jgi:hypothetical protein
MSDVVILGSIIVATLCAAATGFMFSEVRERFLIILALGEGFLVAIVARAVLDASYPVSAVIWVSGLLVAALACVYLGRFVQQCRRESPHTAWGFGAIGLVWAIEVGLLVGGFWVLLAMPFIAVATGLVVLAIWLMDAERFADHQIAAWWLSTGLAAVASFIVGWTLAASVAVTVGGFDAEYVIIRDYNITVDQLDLLIFAPGALLASIAAGAVGTRSPRRIVLLSLVTMSLVILGFQILVDGGWYLTARERVGAPGAALALVLGVTCIAWLLRPASRAASNLPTAVTRLFGAACLLVVFEIALLLDNEEVVFWGGIALAAVIGIIARRWWLVPLIPTALIILLNIHVRLFGEIVRLPPEYGWEVEFAPFAFALSLWFASLFSALVGTVIGYVATMDRWHLRTYGLPALLLTLPTLGVFWLDELGAMILFAVAFAIGCVMRPARLWGVWLGAIIVWWLASGVYSVFGDLVEETPIDYMIESIPFTALLVLLPMSLGRWFGRRPDIRHRGQQEIRRA